MIAFASLFLGLLVGVLPVSVVVGDEVAAVTYELDGKEVGRLRKTPWTLAVDFGGEVEPHELVARAYGRDGQEIGMTRQWLNLPRPMAETEFVLERDAEGQPRAARLIWGSLLGPDPIKMRVTFDGRELRLDKEQRVALPLYDHFTTHVLSAELEFPMNLRSRADVVLGGGSAGEASTELTAVPLVLEGIDDLPPLGALQGWFSARGQSLRVVAVEKGPADVALVRHPSTDEPIAKFGKPRNQSVSVGGSSYVSEPDRWEMRLQKKDRVNVVWPVARRFQASNAIAELFDMSPDFTAKEGGFLWLLTRLYLPLRSAVPLRFADAVAVAGLHAFGGCSRRAVVLVLGKPAVDDSRYSPEAVRRYLEKIHVPLYVWSLEEEIPGASAWGAAEDVSSTGKLRKAVSRLKKNLERQQVVWIEGRHLPQEIAMTEKAHGVTFLR